MDSHRRSKTIIFFLKHEKHFFFYGGNMTNTSSLKNDKLPVNGRSMLGNEKQHSQMAKNHQNLQDLSGQIGGNCRGRLNGLQLSDERLR